ncbi:hypothetical protein M770_00395 [Pseudomonas aeruginosa VRFPA03]|nr:hypothetical protein M770_00395 [Pseudomonas aeruginosa VRFPA03]
MSLAFETAAGLDAIEIAVDVDLQQVGRMVSGATCFSRDDALETQLAKVEFIDENIDHPHRVVSKLRLYLNPVLSVEFRK